MSWLIERFVPRKIREIMWAIKSASFDRYEIDGHNIVKNRSHNTADRVDLRRIVQYEIMHDMGFDIIDLTLDDGRKVRRFDERNDLLAILSKHSIQCVGRRYG
jgi:hypothetical protein